MKAEKKRCRTCGAPLLSLYDSKDGRCVTCRSKEGGAAISSTVSEINDIEKNGVKKKPVRRKRGTDYKTISVKVSHGFYERLKKMSEDIGTSVPRFVLSVLEEVTKE